MAPGLKKTSDEITETLLEAVDTVIGARLAQLPYDKTIICTIVDDSQSGIGKYRVTADNGVNLFNAYADTDIEYFKGTQVYVKILNNNNSVTRVITGKYTPIIEASGTNSNANGTFYPHKNNSQTLNLGLVCSLSEVETSIVKSFNNTIPYNGYSGMKITFKYHQIGLNQLNTARLRVSVEINYSDADKELNSMRKIPAFSSEDGDYLPVNNIINNTDSVQVSHSLYYYFNNNIKISNIKFNAFFDNINVENSGSFIIDSAIVEFGYWTKSIGPNNDFLIILPRYKNSSVCSQIYNDDDSTRKNQEFEFRYLHINANNEAVLDADWTGTQHKDEQLIAVVGENDNITKNDRFWGLLDNSYEAKKIENSGNNYELVSNNYNWRPFTWNNNIGKNNNTLNTSIEKVKVQLIFQYNRDGWGNLKSQDFYLYNESYSSKSGSLVKGITATFDDGTNGNYFIYDKDGNLLDYYNSSKIRSIQLNYQNSSNENDILNDNDVFSCNFNENAQNTMIIANNSYGLGLQKDGNNWFFKYKIKNNYNQNYNNNLITFTLIHNGTRYTLDKELLFGYSGSEENKFNIKVNYTNNVHSLSLAKFQNVTQDDYNVIVYDYNNQSVDNLIQSSVINNIIAINFANGKATLNYPLSFSQYNTDGEEQYIYNGPTTITYDEKGTIKYNKVNCSLKNINDEKINVKWSVDGNNYKYYFTLSEDGKFAPAKICDLNIPKTFIIVAKQNNNILFKQTLLFERNENITATKPGETETSIPTPIGAENSDIKIKEVNVGRVNNGTNGYVQNGIFMGSIDNGSNEEYGLFCYKGADQLLKITDTGDLKIGISNTATYGDKSKPSGATQILQGEWTVTNAINANKLTTNAGNNTKFIYFNEGVPVAATSDVGNATKPIYLNNGTFTALSSTIGSGKKPIYLNNGTITVSDETVGSNNAPIYLNNGELKAINQITINNSSYDLITAINKMIYALEHNVDLKPDRTIWQQD